MNDTGEPTYSLQVTARLTGLNEDTILFYQEQGFVRCAGSGHYDDEALRTLRRIEHLREACGVNDEGVKLILRLMDELERLRMAER